MTTHHTKKPAKKSAFSSAAGFFALTLTAALTVPALVFSLTPTYADPQTQASPPAEAPAMGEGKMFKWRHGMQEGGQENHASAQHRHQFGRQHGEGQAHGQRGGRGQGGEHREDHKGRGHGRHQGAMGGQDGECGMKRFSPAGQESST